MVPEESNGPTEQEVTQNQIVGKSPRSVVYVDPSEALLVVDIVHEYLPTCPSITIPVLHLVEQHPSGVWKFKSYWKRLVIAPHLMIRMRALFEEHELDAELYEELNSAVMGGFEKDSDDVLWFALSMFPMVPIPAGTILDVITASTVKHIDVNVNFQGRAQRILTTALNGSSLQTGIENPRKENPQNAVGSMAGPSTAGCLSPDDLATLSVVTNAVAGAIEKALIRAVGAYMKIQSPNPVSGPDSSTPTPSLAPAFRRSMGLGRSLASVGAAADTLRPVRAATSTSQMARMATPMPSSPVTLLRRERMSSRRSSPFAASRRVSFVDVLDGAYNSGGLGGAHDGDNPSGGGVPGGGNPGGDDDGNGHDGHGDPGWDRHNRGGFRYPVGRERLLQRRGELPTLRGTTWTHFYCDPNDFDLMVDHRTGTLSPWYASRPDFGETLCHPVAHNVHFMDRELFLSGFLRPFDSRNQSRFASNFPAFDGGGDAITVTDYYGRVVRYAMNFNVYVPPLHTLRDGVPLGVWFEELPLWVQVETQNSFSGMLAACLKGKSAGLLHHDVLSTIVRQHENGYTALYDIAVYAGHPLLQAYPKSLTEPVQTCDRSLADHLARWLNYIQLTTLHGTHLSDRYFLQQFVGSLHPITRRAFGSFLEESASRFRLDDRLPASFAPDRLLTKLLQRAAHDGCTKLVHQPPRASLAASQAVQALHTGLDPVFWGESAPLEVAALSSAPRACFLCGDMTHLVTECPRLKIIKGDPFQARQLQRLLTPAPKPALKSPRDADSKLIRQVGFDDQLDVAPPDDLIADDVPDPEPASDPVAFL